jgi:hypothetical protein
MKKRSKVVKAVVSGAAIVTLAVMIGQITPVNLISNSTDFSLTQVNSECCGPYSQCQCEDFQYVPADQ